MYKEWLKGQRLQKVVELLVGYIIDNN